MECVRLCVEETRAGKRNKQEGGVTSKLCEKTGIIKKQGWCSCDTRYPNSYTEAASFFFPFFLSFFAGANFFGSTRDHLLCNDRLCGQGNKDFQK